MVFATYAVPAYVPAQIMLTLYQSNESEAVALSLRLAISIADIASWLACCRLCSTGSLSKFFLVMMGKAPPIVIKTNISIATILKVIDKLT